MYILGIETSCDETAAAVLQDGHKILSNVVASQIKVHHQYGGVVPELASREHIKNIGYVVSKALQDAEIDLRRLDAIAVTQGPGLVGSLLVGISYAKAMAYSLKISLIPINHIEGHIFSAFLEHPHVEYPLLALVVSGGHTALYYSPELEKYTLVGQTRDDAAGEAFDKVAKLIGLGYPGGPIIDKLSDRGNPKALNFSIPKISDRSLDFSFSGIKTAVLRYVQHEEIPKANPTDRRLSKKIYDLIASFQRNVVDTLLDRTLRAADLTHPKSIILAGGVACNRLLREVFKKKFSEKGISIYYPSSMLTTDNAAMIAAAGYPKLRRYSKFDSAQIFDLNANANLRLA